jgi:hypothetical protein
MKAARLVSTAVMAMLENILHIIREINRAHRIEKEQKKFYFSGEAEQQVARQEGVAGGANLLRRSAHEMTEKMNMMITHTWVRAH